MDGRLVVEQGDVYDLIAIAKSNTRPEARDARPPSSSTSGAASPHAPILRAVGLKAARANVAHHYDLDERLYRLFLDDDMQYSCAYFERPGHDARRGAARQEAPDRRQAAGPSPAPASSTSAAAGAGWRSTSPGVCGADVHRHHPVAGAAPRRHRARRRAPGLVRPGRFRLQDYREVDGHASTTSSRSACSSTSALRHYPTFFRTVARLLDRRRRRAAALDGRSRRAALQPAVHRQVHLSRRLHPRAVRSPPGGRERRACSSRDVEILSLHYAETLARMAPALPRQPRARSRRLYDERFCRMWEFYLAGSESAFRYDAPRTSSTCSSPGRRTRVPLTRDYIPAAMARLAEAELAIPGVRRAARRCRA